MKKTILALLIIIGSMSNAQSIDYNTKKGFAAEGYDVVSYFSNEAKEGSNKYIAVYDEIKYKFSSKENLIIFKSVPKKHLPQYGGYCAYAVAIKGKKVSIDPETFEIRDGKLYLFFNSWGTNTLKSWLCESPTKLQLTADENWNRIKNNLH